MAKSSEEKAKTRIQLEKELNEQQKRFCEAKLFNNNVQSYLIAYTDCEYKSASASATRLLEDARIKQYIEYLKDDIENITGVSKIRNVAELSKIAYSNISELHDTWVELKDWEKIKKDNPEVLNAIEAIDTKTEIRQSYNLESDKKENVEVKYIKVKFYSKVSAIDLINKMMGYNEPEKLQHSGGVNIINLGSGKKPE